LFKQIEQANNYSGKMFFFLYKGVVAYLLGKSPEAYDLIKKSGDFLFSVPGLIILVDYHTYTALVILELISSSDSDEELQKSLDESITVLEKWNDSIPENFQFRLDLIHGIQKEMEKDYLGALDFYESAIQLSSTQEVLPIKAIAAEKAGKMMLKIGHDRLGNLYLKDAYSTYSVYGARIKLNELENQFPNLFGKQGNLGSRSGIKSSTSLNSLEMFDSHTLVKASLAISQEITLKGVLTKMMEVVFENSGAEKGIFLLEENGKWKIEAKGSINPRKFKFLQGVDYPGSKKSQLVPPVEIVNYVQNTQNSLLLEDARGSTDFGHLEHFKKNRVKSVLCLPVLRHRELKAILYLENSLSAGTFTSSQLELINTLSSQIAISITNAQLYEELEQKVLDRTAEIQSQKEELEKTLANLRQTQGQLIQSEKMASLGELTAGIAHEIQNPLNFVNNFSDVSNELIEELKVERSKLTSSAFPASEVKKEKRDISIEDELINDITKNLEKINYHGKRASEIVRSMLQHSRTSTGEKELTDINVLCYEYLRLAYHGMRAKDKSFNAEYKLDLDESLPKIHVVPQDIGRVLLNLINNAFYAVDEKAKENIEGYQPIVEVSTKKHDSFIEICVKDNGGGIPEQVRDKIFQPFFTTKPSGHGTGLGLSLSYEIINKRHGGSIKVESTIGKGSTFIIRIPAG
jgi:signal transduction histidine kinase